MGIYEIDGIRSVLPITRLEGGVPWLAPPHNLHLPTPNGEGRCFKSGLAGRACAFLSKVAIADLQDDQDQQAKSDQAYYSICKPINKFR